MGRRAGGKDKKRLNKKRQLQRKLRNCKRGV